MNIQDFDKYKVTRETMTEWASICERYTALHEHKTFVELSICEPMKGRGVYVYACVNELDPEYMTYDPSEAQGAPGVKTRYEFPAEQALFRAFIDAMTPAEYKLF